MRVRRTKLLRAAILGIVGLLLATGASASIPDATVDVMTACYSQARGTFRAIDYQAGVRCASSEIVLRWSEKEPPAPWGSDGKTILNGSGPPATQGSLGDLYLDKASYTVYGPKTEQGWSSGTRLVTNHDDGYVGAQGLQGIALTDAPSALAQTAPTTVTSISGTVLDGLLRRPRQSSLMDSLLLLAQQSGYRA